AACLVNHANLLRKKGNEPKAVAAQIEKAINILRKLSDDYPYPLYKRDLARAYNSLAAVDTQQLSDYRAADDNWTEARKVCEQLTKDNPDNAEFQSLLGDILGGQAW